MPKIPFLLEAKLSSRVRSAPSPSMRFALLHPSRYSSAILLFTAGSRTTIQPHLWVFVPLGARIAASRISQTTSSGIGFALQVSHCWSRVNRLKNVERLSLCHAKSFQSTVEGYSVGASNSRNERCDSSRGACCVPPVSPLPPGYRNCSAECWRRRRRLRNRQVPRQRGPHPQLRPPEHGPFLGSVAIQPSPCCYGPAVPPGLTTSEHSLSDQKRLVTTRGPFGCQLSGEAFLS